MKTALTRNAAVLTSKLAHNAAGPAVTAPIASKHAKKANHADAKKEFDT
jgi:hypothetical protein